MKTLLIYLRLPAVFALVLISSFAERASAEGTPIRGVFHSGDLREQFRNWGAKWYLTDQLQSVYLFEGKTYRWESQSRPDDSRYEVRLPRLPNEITGAADPDRLRLGDIKTGTLDCASCRGESTRANVAATLQGIARWYRPKATEPYARANSLFRTGYATEHLNEVWLNTEKGALYFVGSEIYLWTGRAHGQNPLVASVGLGGFHPLLAYAALNPMPLPHLLAGSAGLVGGFPSKKAVLRELWVYNYLGVAEVVARNLKTKEYGDMLDRSVAEVSIPSLHTNLALATFVNGAGAGYFERTIGIVPHFLSAYERQPLYLGPGIEPAPRMGQSSNGKIGFNIDAGYYLFPGARLDFFPYNRDIVFEMDQPGTKRLEIQVGPRKWLAAVVSVSSIKPQINAGRVISTVLPASADNRIVMRYGESIFVNISGWTTPIADLIIGRHTCSAVKTILVGGSGSLAGQTLPFKHRSSVNGDTFKCVLIGTPPTTEKFVGPIKVKLTNGKVFDTSAVAEIPVPLNSSDPRNSALRAGFTPDNCASVCQMSGGVLPLNDAQEEQLCRSSNPYGNYSVNRQSGGYGCLWGQGAPNQNHPGFGTHSFAGPANRAVKVARRVCFCRVSNTSFRRWINGDLVPTEILE